MGGKLERNPEISRFYTWGKEFLSCRTKPEQKKKNTKFDHQLNENVAFYEKILPTDYKSPQYGSIEPVEDPNTWIYHE